MEGIQVCLLVLFLFCFIIATNSASDSKYSAFKNTKAEDILAEKPFRAAKVNLVWEKAKKRLDKDKQAEIFNELGFYDHATMDFKKKRAENENYDENGEHEAIIRQSLMQILQKYGISDTHPDPVVNEIVEDDVKSKKINEKDWNKIMKDKKLSELWKVASNSGFNKVELDALRVEFLHHQQKVNEYTELKNEIDVVPVDETHENSIHRFQGTKDNFKDDKRKKGHLKEKHFDLKASYERLAGQISGDNDANTLGLSDHRVIDLWLMMKKSNISESELDSFKQELKHFEHKLTKREHFAKEAEAAKVMFDGAMGKSNDIKAVKLEQIESKVTEYDQKIKKIHTELKDRIGKAVAHSEL